ncbi:DER1 [Linum perenne]
MISSTPLTCLLKDPSLWDYLSHYDIIYSSGELSNRCIPCLGTCRYSDDHFCWFSEQIIQMSTPGEYYRSLPPVSKTYGVVCLMTSAAFYLGLYNPFTIALFYGDVFKRFQIWRLLTNFFFLGPFSFPFAFRLIIIARYGVSLERGPFDKRTADFVWMFFFGAISLLLMAVVPALWSPFMGISLVFMIVYIWSREFPNDTINIYGLVSLKGFYLPWAMLGLDLIFGDPLKPDILGIVAGHLYYYLTVLYPLSGGKYYYIFKTPRFVSYRLGQQTTSDSSSGSAASQQQQQGNSQGAFRGRGYRLGGAT